MPQKALNPEIRHLNNMMDKYTPNIVTCRRHLMVLPHDEHKRRYEEHVEKCGTKSPVSRPAKGDMVAWENFFTLLDETSRLQSQPHSHVESMLSPLLYIIAPLMYPPKLLSNEVFIFGRPPAYG
jgi:hypothetical protein